METLNIADYIATACFAFAIIHTFMVKQFQHLALRFQSGSVGENFFHLLGEVEIVFGIWAGVYLVFRLLHDGADSTIHYLETRNFTEPGFVFVIMAVCATRPILSAATTLIATISKAIPLRKPVAFYVACLVIGPVLGSFITEPAAMTVTALILLERYYRQNISQSLMYATIGLLFVNISIGGTLTPYAAPPVLMVAKVWNWDFNHMFSHFGWKALIAILISTALVVFRFRKELENIQWSTTSANRDRIPHWVTAVHLAFLIAVILSAHHLVVFSGVFLFFLGLVSVTKEYQRELALKEGLLVAFFLGGLVVLGGPQRWWLEPILTHLEALPLFLGGLILTAITDNAALTYLGAQVPNLSEASRYALVAGAVTGGGLTVIANAPNPAGYGILNSAFGEEGISPLKLLVSAIPPTLISAACFWLL
jgi:Na+/H+ antiporter NhaD/arsenite permease-like protein